METGSSTRPGRRWVAIALAALLALTVAIPATGAGAASPGKAVAAKKCKKKKKKKCKKHVLSLPGPIVRATISWASGDVDLYAFDASGNRSGAAPGCSIGPCPISEGIPNAVHSPDAINGGAENFTDNIFIRGGTTNREFAYAVCFYADATVTFTGVNRFGQSQTLPVSGVAGEGHSLTTTGGPPVPASFACSL